MLPLFSVLMLFILWAALMRWRALRYEREHALVRHRRPGNASGN